MGEGADFRRSTITVAGVEVEIDVDLDLGIASVSEDMDKVASQMGFWSEVWGAAVEESINADAHYRAWRARLTQQILEEDPKMAEWKVRAAIEAHPQFLLYKAGIAKAEHNVTKSKGVFNAFDKKGNVLQSKGAMLREERSATGMHTPETPRPKPKRDDGGKAKKSAKIKHKNPADGDPRRSSMKTIFKK